MANGPPLEFLHPGLPWSIHRVYVRLLELTNFRNFRRASVELPDGPVLVMGDNGQGKTNLLEAVELLATAKSSRVGNDRELVHWAALGDERGPLAEPFARVRATVDREGREFRSEVLIRDTGGAAVAIEPASVSKTFRVNGLSKRALEFVGTVNAVTFSPLDVALVAGSPSGRRRYLDVMNSQVNPTYLYALQRYQKVLFQRNHLLREMRAHRMDDASLSVWTEQLLAEGAFLVWERALSIAKLTPLADRWYRELGGLGTRLEISYRPALGGVADVVQDLPDSEDALSRVRDAFADELQRARPREAAAGLSLVGPHRDDLRFLLDGVDLNVYGSRGQQRLGALALKLAEADHLEQRSGSRPILLMDDVLSELDRKRQTAVLKFIAVGGGQTLLTTTSLGAIDAKTRAQAQILVVSAGMIEG